MPNTKKTGKKSKASPAKKSKPGDSGSSVATLSTVLGLMVSILVVVAAILIKPLVENVREYTALIFRDLAHDVESNVTTWPPADPRVGFLVSRACFVGFQHTRDDQIYCHPHLRVSQRHFRATKRIEPGEVLFEIPRSMQLWDLQALRDPWIRLHLFEASHRLTGNKVGIEAFLAAYLALQLKRKEDTNRPWELEVLDLSYFDSLYRYDDWNQSHPLLADPKYMKSMLGFSEGFMVLQAHRNMIISEYEAFSDFSKHFREMITKEDYFSARINVLTRAIRVGPPGPEQSIKTPFLQNDYTPEQLLQDEVESYKEILDIDLMKNGCIALVPITDLLNHHPQNNAEYVYTKTERNRNGAVVVRAEHRRVEAGFEPMISYGRHLPDAHLYARFGFVNGDGSGPVQVSLAYHHDILKPNISSQYDYLPLTGPTTKFIEFLNKPLAEYLRYDDGYSDCIPGLNTHPDEATLKRFKHKHLLRIANSPEHWQIIVPARNPFVYPGYTHVQLLLADPPEPIPFYMREHLNFDYPLATCRLISLTVRDYKGRASQILQENLMTDENFLLTEGNDSLEYRAWHCVRRWLEAGLTTLENTFGSTRSEMEAMLQLNLGTAVGTREWGAANVRLGEMQSLQAAAVVVREKITDRWGFDVPLGDEYIVREEPCPSEYHSYLFDLTEASMYTPPSH